jgi:G:T/U-mismatch repair DNA glycosylase
MEVTVKHQSIEANWLAPNSINNPQTLVLGSFNPYKNNSELVDYYYGRKSNHFWKTIAIIINENENFFFQSGTSLERKKEIMNKF